MAMMLLIHAGKRNFVSARCHSDPLAMTVVFVLGLLSLIMVPLACADQIFVRPSEDTPCPSDECYLLPHVLRSATEYLTSNTTVTLTPGHYFVNEDILAMIRDVSNLTITGSNSGSTVIECREQFGLVFSNATGLLISNLRFFNCSQQIQSATNPVGLTANYSDVTLINTSFINLVGSSIHALHSNVKLLGQAVFDGIRCGSGCGISTYSSNIDFLGTVVFQNNTCSIGCGILATENSNLEFLGTSVFQNNTCSSGCGIAALDNINISFNGSATFEGNNAEGIGSGITVQSSSNLEFLGTAVFQGNTCSYGCGILATDNSNLEFLGTAVFQNNTCSSGCGIAALDNINISFNGSATFEGNNAEGSVTAVNSNNLEFLGTAVFQNNTCSHGCGIAASDNIGISFHGRATFDGNKAEGSGSGIVVFKSSKVEFLGIAVFQNNTCSYGCGIAASDNNNISFNGSAMFEGNKAKNSGSGIFVFVRSNLMFLGIAMFQNNTCLTGCGISASDNVNISFKGSVTFEGNKAEGFGGIDAFFSCNLQFLGTAVFQNNMCLAGCGIRASDNSNLAFLGTAVFQNNTCTIGCGIAASDNIGISFHGSAKFDGNKAENSGSGIFVHFSSYLEFLGTVVFQNNTCTIGCSIKASGNSTLEFLGTTVFQNNICTSGCGIAASNNTNISFNKGAILEGNKVEGTGSDISAEHSNNDFLGTVVFRNNTCTTFGCGIAASNNSNLEFLGTAVFQNNTCSTGCGILASNNTNIIFVGSATFEGNKAKRSGSSMVVVNSSNLDFLDIAVFQNNVCYAGCGIFALYNSKVSFSASAIFKENEANMFGGAVVTSSTIKFNSSATFHNNRAAQGGALYLIMGNNPSQLLLDTGAEVKFTGNYVSETGGAIRIQSSTLSDSCRLIASITAREFVVDIRTCFYQCVNQQVCPKVYLQENRADVAGNAIYGDVQKCASFNDIISIQSFHNESDLSLIASDPTRVCFCVNGTPNCSIVSQNRTLYPGETFEIPVVVVGDAWGVTIGAALAVLPSNASLAKAQISQALQLPLCTNLTYNVYSDPGAVTMQLVIKEVQVGLMTDIGADGRSCTTIYIHLTLLLCPPGFQVDSNRACNCNQILQNHDIFNCSIDNKTVYRPDHYWISASVSGSTTVHEQCPLDYCMPHNMPVIPNYPDKQCQFNRSGTLCGGCKANLSMVFGSSRCLKCSKWWLFLIPLFAFAGIALVFLLTVFNLTISMGTINGLIFYSNIVRANTAVFFPPTQSTAVMIPSVFIAWLNLDLGIDVCFYNGLDTFAKTWLQLVFPVYVWILVIGIIISSHYSTWAARLSGKNSVPVLATLFLLSYAKLLRVMIAAFSFTTLDTYQIESTANSSREYVWLYDGNVQYLQGKHIPLFLAAVVILAALAAPYTLMVIFVQCLQRYRYRLLFWVRRLKPLFDAYTGPYKDRHRYWTGLLLLVRVGLFLFFAVIQNVVGQPSLSLLAIIFTAVSLLVFHGMVGGVYKLVYLNLLESFFLVNLICFSGATLYTALTGGNQVAAVCTSVGLAFAVFVVLVLHSAYRSLRCITHFPRIRRQQYTLAAQPLMDGHEVDAEAQPQGQRVTSQVLFFNELREPVMEYCEESNN